MRGGFSGGTAATIVASFDGVPKDELRKGSEPFALSPSS
jgi:hypothetical protein